VKGQAGQWREEWAAVVRWADRLQDSANLAEHLDGLGLEAQGDPRNSAGFIRAASYARGQAGGIWSVLTAIGKAKES
jgi:hypothetical protein